MGFDPKIVDQIQDFRFLGAMGPGQAAPILHKILACG